MGSSDLKDRLGPALFDGAPCLVAVVDPDHRIVITNRAFREVFGADAEGEPCYAVYKGRDEPCEDCFAGRVFAGQDATSSERGVGRDGDEVPYKVHAVPLRNEDGEVELMVQMALDRGEREALEHSLQQAETLANVGLSTAGLAHTIKNILAGLEGGTYVVDSGLDKQDMGRVKGGWSMVQKYLDQVTTLVRNLLRYARAQPPAKEPVAPADLVQGVMELYESKAGLLEIDLVAEVEPDLEPVMMDPQAMHACLTNLVTNALDACSWDPDGDDKQHRVVISACRREAEGERGPSLVLEVVDNGMGIPEQDQPRILQEHFTSKGMRGTGLGLLLTRKTVTDHQGRVSFTTEPGEGTTFRIELPAVGPAEDGGETAGAADVSQGMP